MLEGRGGSVQHSKSRVVPRSGVGIEEYLGILGKELHRQT